MDNTSLLNQTLNLVKNRNVNITYQQIATECGVSIAWLKAFTSGRIKEPSVTKIENVYNYLSK